MIIKAYTDIEQSKKLENILPLESADMYYSTNDNNLTYNNVPLLIQYNEYTTKYYIPCWSLAALLNIIPKDEIIDCSIFFGYYNSNGEYRKWLCFLKNMVKQHLILL